MSNKVNYTDFEIDWVECRLDEIKEYIDNTPYNKIEDRVIILRGTRGDSEKVSATVESQQKAYREALREYVSLVEAVAKLRERESLKVEVRGSQEVSPRVQALLNKS